MSESPEIRFKLLGDSSSLFKALEDATKRVKSTTGDIEKQFSGMSSNLNGIIDKVKGPFLAFTAILGGGSIFKKAVDETVAYGKEINNLSRQLGITKEQASALSMAIGDIYGDTDEYLKLAAKFTKTISTNEEGLKKLGVQSRDNQGNFRNSNDVLLETFDALSKFKEGTDRNVEAQKIFGKSYQESAKYINLTKDAMKEAEDKAKRLNLVFGPEKEQNVKNYRAAMNDVEDVMKGLQVNIGNELLPVLTDLGVWFSEVGPGVLTVFSYALKGIMTAVYTITFVIKTFASVLGAVFGGILDSIGDVGDAISKLFKGDFKGAYEASKEAGKKILTNFSAAKDQISEDWDKLGEKLGNTWDGSSKKSKSGSASDGKNADTDKDGAKIIAIHQAQLETKRLQQAELLNLDKDFYDLSKKEEFDFWVSKLSLYSKNTKEYDEVAKQVDSVRKAMKSEEFANNKAVLDLELSASKDNVAKQLKLAYEYLTNLKKTHAENSKEVIEAQKRIQEIKNAGIEEQKKINDELLTRERQHALAMLEIDEVSIKGQRKSQEIFGAEEIRLLDEIAEKKYQILLRELNDKLLIEGIKKEETEKILTQIQALNDSRDKQIIEKNMKLDDELQKTDGWLGFYGAITSYLDKAKNAGEMFRDAMNSVFSSVETGMSNAINGIISGTQTVGQALSNVFKSMATSVIGSISQIISKMLVQNAVQQMISRGYIAGKTAERVADLAGIPAKTASTAATTAKATADAAGTGPAVANAAGNTFQAHSGIPIVGAIIAAGLVLMMLSTMSKITARATGGLINSPQLTLMGEAGPEVVAPERDFKHWANNLVLTGAAIQGSISGHNSRMSGYNINSSNYSNALSDTLQSGSNAGINPTLNLTLNHSVVGHSREGLEEIYFKALQNYNRRSG